MRLEDEQRIQKQFTSFCATILKNEARHIKRDSMRRKIYEKSFNELTLSEIQQISTADTYFKQQHIFFVLNLPIVVEGDFLASAIQKLPKTKQEIILLSYFCDMSDREIAALIHTPRSTVTNQRNKSLQVLQQYLRKEGFEWKDS